MSSSRIWISTNNMFWTNSWDQCLFFCFSDLQLAYNFWVALYFWLELKKTLLHPFDLSFDYKKMKSVNNLVINCIFIKKNLLFAIILLGSFNSHKFSTVSNPSLDSLNTIKSEFWTWSWLRVLILTDSNPKFWKSQPSS
jgi:hypothetical protein